MMDNFWLMAVLEMLPHLKSENNLRKRVKLAFERAGWLRVQNTEALAVKETSAAAIFLPFYPTEWFPTLNTTRFYLFQSKQEIKSTQSKTLRGGQRFHQLSVGAVMMISFTFSIFNVVKNRLDSKKPCMVQSETEVWFALLLSTQLNAFVSQRIKPRV